ncbi:MAG: GNAT family N-acetyltransferase [Rhizobiaceae bacterium]
MSNMVISTVTTDAEKDICYHLRHVVFVEEQGVPVELEIDEFDASDAHHFLGLIDGKPAATARICLFGDKAKIQRVVVMKQFRGRNLGRQLMQHLMDFARRNNLAPQIALDAQTYAVPFYQSLGFETIGEEFDDAGIAHIHMTQKA